MPAANPFLNAVPDLYATADRLTRRTNALHRAKISGRHAADVIADLAPSDASVIADIGCGRGTTTLVLAARLRPNLLIALDASAALLDAARQRVARPGARFVRADFHHLPLTDRSCDLIIAAFCLYHSPNPSTVIAEIARCLTSGGTAILATKSADSYRELDEVMATSGLDPDATRRPSLYETADSKNLPTMVKAALHVRDVISDHHVFRFTGLNHAAEYLATSPKYALPNRLRHDPAAIAAELRARLPDRPLTTSSTITYTIATRP
jgi:ubiquinone/menaquinone biosynthesis C-methylase UbiE